MPRIRIVDPSQRSALERFLRVRVEHSMFLLGNLHLEGIEDRGGPRHGTYAVAWEGDDIVGAVCHYRRGNVVINAPDCAVELTRAAIAASGRPLGGVVGPEDEVDAVDAALGFAPGSASCDERETLYRLPLADLRIPAAVRDGSVRGRALAQADIEQVIAWTVRYRVEAVGDAENETLWSTVRGSVPQAVEQGNIWVLEHRGKLVAKTAYNAQVPDAVQVGGVWTPVELRGNGYGRCVVASHLLAARERGVSLGILFTGDDNLPARRAYEALGFDPIGRYRVVILREPLPR